MKNVINILAILLLVSSSCKKAEDRSCWKFAGDEAIQEIQIESFDSLELGGKMKFDLIHDTINKIVLNGYENLNNLILVQQRDSKIDILNENKCNYLRSFKKKVTVEIHYTDFNTLIFKGSEELRMTNEFNTPSFNLKVFDGAGPMFLDVNSTFFSAVLVNGHGDLTLNGSSSYAFLRAQGATYFNTENFICSDSLVVSTNSSADLFVNANTTKFRTEIDGRGDVYYKGTPQIIESNNVGEGQLINNN